MKLQIPRRSRVLISFREWLHSYPVIIVNAANVGYVVLISFREWLHSYKHRKHTGNYSQWDSSHLFQRVASFLLIAGVQASDFAWAPFSSLSESGFIPTGVGVPTAQAIAGWVLISFREWLHSYIIREMFINNSATGVLISFREWLHSY